MSTDKKSSAPDCPFPCGWQGLHKIAVQDAAYLAKVQWPEDEEGVSVPRATAMRCMDYLIQVCRTMLNAAPVAAQAHPTPTVPAETLRVCGVIADKIEDGSLFQSGIYRDSDLAGFVRQVLRSVSAAQAQQPVSGAKVVPNTIEQIAVYRYRSVPSGLIGYKVVAGDGSRSLFSGTKNECYIVARKLTEAFLDGAYVALQDQQPVSGADGLRVVLEEIHDWMDSQADAQSKGCHATFDIMMLRELRDKAKFALDHFPDATEMVEPSGDYGELPRLPLNDPAAAYRVLHDYGQSCARAALAQQDAARNPAA